MARKSTKATVVAEPATIADVRAWARENGIEVASRGRIASTVREAFTTKTGRPISG
jgi:hypothetical protein